MATNIDTDANMEKMIDKPLPVKPRPVTPTAECLECKLFLTFMTCFGLTFADMKRKL